MKKTLIATTSALALALSLGAVPAAATAADSSVAGTGTTAGIVLAQAQRILPADENQAPAAGGQAPAANQGDDLLEDEEDAGTLGDVPPVEDDAGAGTVVDAPPPVDDGETGTVVGAPPTAAPVDDGQSEATGTAAPDVPAAGAPRDVAALPAEDGVQPDGTHLSDGMVVRTPDGERLADVSRYVFDDQGQITHVVVSFGGFLGFGAKEVMLPWERFETRGGDQPTLVLAITQEELEAMPSFRSAAAVEADRLREQQQMQQQTDMPPAAVPTQ